MQLTARISEFHRNHKTTTAVICSQWESFDVRESDDTSRHGVGVGAITFCWLSRCSGQGYGGFSSEREFPSPNWRAAGPGPGPSIWPMAGTNRSSAGPPMMFSRRKANFSSISIVHSDSYNFDLRASATLLSRCDHGDLGRVRPAMQRGRYSGKVEGAGFRVVAKGPTFGR